MGVDAVEPGQRDHRNTTTPLRHLDLVVQAEMKHQQASLPAQSDHDTRPPHALANLPLAERDGFYRKPNLFYQ